VARAGLGAIARTASPILLLCFDYDAATGRYTPAVMKLLRLAAAITMAALAGLILRSRLAERGA
jgi:protein SCO1/2